MQDVEEQGLNQTGVAVHPLEIKTLEMRERQRIALVVKNVLELPAPYPLFQPIGQ